MKNRKSLLVDAVKGEFTSSLHSLIKKGKIGMLKTLENISNEN